MTENNTIDAAVEALENARGIEGGSVEEAPFGEIEVLFNTTGGWEDIGVAAADEIDAVEFSRYTSMGKGYFSVRA